jgi:hypothetical protein
MRLWCGNCRLTRAHRLNAIGALVCRTCGFERGPAVARRKCKDAQHSAMWRDGWARCVVCGKDMRPYRPNARPHAEARSADSVQADVGQEVTP